MKLEKAKKNVQKLVACFNFGNKSMTLNCEEFEAIVIVAQELERLQKENRKLKGQLKKRNARKVIVVEKGPSKDRYIQII